ncbi:hypothetical protein ACRCNB_30070, partial [Klebsiella michiganensis]
MRLNFPEAMLAHLPGYRPADNAEPVARARRVKRRPREQSAERLNFPEAMLRICPGLYDYSVRKNRPVLSDGGPDAVSGLRLSRLFR